MTYVFQIEFDFDDISAILPARKQLLKTLADNLAASRKPGEPQPYRQNVVELGWKRPPNDWDPSTPAIDADPHGESRFR